MAGRRRTAAQERQARRMAMARSLFMGLIILAGVFGSTLGVGFGFAHLIAKCA